MSIKDKENITSKNSPKPNNILDEAPSKNKITPNEDNMISIKMKPINKHQEAKGLVNEAKSIIDVSNNEVQDCKLLLEEDLKSYKEAKENLKSSALNESEALLVHFNFIAKVKKGKENSVVFEPKDDIKPIVLRDVYSGKITGLIISLIAGFLTLIGLLYLAIVKREETFDFAAIPSNETMTSIVSWFSTLVGYDASFNIGASLLGAIILIVMFIVYMVRVSLKAGKNLNFANNQMKKTKEYIAKKTNCKTEMDKVDAHIQDSIKTLKDYTIVLSEKNATLKRIRHFEGLHKDIKEYSEKSTSVMKNTQILVSKIENFIETAMSEEGKLSDKSTFLLNNAKDILQKELSHF